MSITNNIPIPSGYDNPVVFSNNGDTYMYLDVRAGNGDSIIESESGWLYWYDTKTGTTGDRVEYNGTSVLCYNSKDQKWFSVNDTISELTAETVVFSVYDVYNTRSERSYIGTSVDDFINNNTAIGHNITSSTLLSSLIKPFSILLPFVLGAVVVWLGFRKGWAWLKGNAKGA